VRWVFCIALALTFVAILLPRPVLGLTDTGPRQAAAAAVLPPGEILPSAPGFGRTAGSFSVSEDGAAQYAIPLWVPKGRGKATPELSLVYDSRGGNGPLGVGWVLRGLPSIAPCPRTIAQDGYTERFHLNSSDAYCLGGSRMVRITPAPIPPGQLSEVEYRTEQESFSRIRAYGMEDGVPNFFKVWDKDGRILSLGVTPAARQAAFPLGRSDEPGSTTRVTVAWAVDRVEDRNGNFFTVAYTHEDGDFYTQRWTHMRPTAITYAPNRRVEFRYQTRTDPIDGFGAGVHTRFPVRLSGITMFAGPQGGGDPEPLRDYRLAYRNDSVTGRSLLASVTECDGADKCKVPLPLEYSLGGYGFQPIATSVTDLNDGRLNGETDYIGSLLTVGDMTGDGRDDLVYRNKSGNWVVRHSTGAGFGPPISAGIPSTGPHGLTEFREPLRVVDIDADGRIDVMVEVPDNSYGGTGWKLYRSDGTRFVAYPDNIGYFGPADDDLDPVYFLDLDGNGLPDLLRARYELEPGNPPRTSLGPWFYRLNTGKAGAERFAQEVRVDVAVPSRPTGNVVADSDGDGRQELIAKYEGDDGVRRTRSLGLNAAGGLEALLVELPFTQHMGDVNGDGLADSVDTYFGGLYSTISVGTGSAFRQYGMDRYAPPKEQPTGAGFFDRGARIVDFNNDGRDDVLIFQGGEPTGEDDRTHGIQLYTWRDLAGHGPDGGPAFIRAPISRSAGDPHDRLGFDTSQPLDIDGNGVLDLVYPSDGSLQLLRRTAGVPDRLTAVGNRLNRERIEVDYAPLSDRAVHIPTTNCTYPQVCLTKGGAVVAQHRSWTFATSGGAAGWDRATHVYLGAKTDLQGRGWLGFASHIVTRALTGAQTVTQFDNTTRNTAIKAYPFAGQPNRVTTTVKDSPTGREHQSVTETVYGVRRHLGGGYSVEPRQVDATEQERPAGGGAWTTLRQNTTTNFFDDYGNVALSTSATTGGRTVVDDPTYDNDTDAWLLGLPTRSQTKVCTKDDAVPCKTRVSTFDYDDKGNQVLAVTEPDRSELKLSAVTAYDAVGNVTSVTRTPAVGNQRRERFEYDADKVHPTATINALEHRTSIVTHSGLGVPLLTTDPNGVATAMSYDGFGRPRGTKHADGGFEKITHSVVLGSDITTTTTAGGAVSAVSTDQLGRQTSTQVKTFAGTTAITSTNYDPLGRARAVSRPKGPGEQYQYTITDYDNRDRPTRVTAPDGVVTRTEYVNRETHRYDGRNVHSYTVTNVDGETEFSYEDDPESSSWLRTRYEYGPFGEVTKAVAPDDTQQVMEYDVLGRRTKLDDPSTGVTETTYNAFGEPVEEIDGNGDTTVIERNDALGRVTETTSSDGTATNVWDTAAYGKGLLAKAISTDGVVTVNTYTEHSKPESNTWTVEGTGYRIDYTYDGFGRQSGITYPAIPGGNGRLAVAYGYNPSGYLSQVRNAAGSQVYWTGEERDSAGQLTKVRLGLGGTSVVGTRRYNTVGLLTGVSVDGAVGGRMSDIEYVYDENRNVVKRQDNVNARPDRYSYDSLNRLRTWRLTTSDDGDIVTGYDYDEVGNLKSETVSGHPERNATYVHGSDEENGDPPHALTARNGVHYEYDHAGQQVSGAGRTVSYNQAGLPKALTWGQAQRTDFRYDAAGARVLKRDGGNTLLTIGGLFERRSPEAGGTEIHNLHNIVVDGRVVAQVNRTQATPTGPATDPIAQYLHGDMQGSTVLVTNAAGRPADTEGSWLREIFYDPFGRRVQADGTPLGNQRRGGPHQGYTGHELDGEFGLINMKGRIYDPEQRRFLTPDSVVPDPLSSQDYNRYAYVRNNPATNTDPTGHIVEQGPYSAGPSGIGSSWLGDLHPPLPPQSISDRGGALDRPPVTEVHQMFLGGPGKSPAADDDDSNVTTVTTLVGGDQDDGICEAASSSAGSRCDGSERTPTPNQSMGREDMRGTEPDTNFWADLFMPYLFGGGDEVTINNDKNWSAYMMANEKLRSQLDPHVSGVAVAALGTYLSGNGEHSGFYQRFAAEVQNGWFTGYALLHGTDMTVGGFQFWGLSSVTPNSNGTYQVMIDGRYTWNDRMNSKPSYRGGDRVFPGFFEVLTFGHAEFYTIHITWSAQTQVTLRADGSVVDLSGYPGCGCR
jgi:RHS repeat-associated protein